jgi:tRNA splicing endonuclease
MNENPLINDTLLQMKYARVVTLLARRLAIPEEEALRLFYGSETYRELSDLRNGLQNMGDLYLADSVILENRESSGLTSELEKERRQYREGDTVACATKGDLTSP